eukprot:1742952-Prymnesium_polylepis.1
MMPLGKKNRGRTPLSKTSGSYIYPHLTFTLEGKRSSRSDHNPRHTAASWRVHCSSDEPACERTGGA